jgi:hypothetical protein
MKNLLHCPHCAGKRIWIVEKYRVPGESAEGRLLPVVPHQPSGKASPFRSLRQKPVGYLDLYLCDGCGYAELWAGGFRDLAPDPARGIQLIDTTDVAAGPFR